MIDQIIYHVLDRWDHWDATTRLQNIFDTKHRIMKAVRDAEGSIEYAIPRSKKSHKGENPTFIPPKRRRDVSQEESSEDEEENEESLIEMNVEEEQIDIINNPVLDYWRRKKASFMKDKK